MSQYKSLNSLRYKKHDYRDCGYYFITLCTKNREPYFGKIKNGIIGLSEVGCIAYQYWYEIPDHFSNVKLDEFIVMPDHIHFLIYLGISEKRNPLPNRSDRSDRSDRSNRSDRWCVQLNTPTIRTTIEPTIDEKLIKDKEYYSQISPLKDSISVIIRTYKAAVKRWCNQNNFQFEWQRGFYDRIVWETVNLPFIRKYILNNPIKWYIKQEKIQKKLLEIRNNFKKDASQ